MPRRIQIPIGKKDRDGHKGGQNTRPRLEGKTQGPVETSTGRPLCILNTLEVKYCNAFLDNGKACKFGKACTFKHATVPG